MWKTIFMQVNQIYIVVISSVTRVLYQLFNGMWYISNDTSGVDPVDAEIAWYYLQGNILV